MDRELAWIGVSFGHAHKVVSICTEILESALSMVKRFQGKDVVQIKALRSHVGKTASIAGLVGVIRSVVAERSALANA